MYTIVSRAAERAGISQLSPEMYEKILLDVDLSSEERHTLLKAEEINKRLQEIAAQFGE